MSFPHISLGKNILNCWNKSISKLFILAEFEKLIKRKETLGTKERKFSKSIDDGNEH